MPNGLDCSGFIAWVLKNAGFDPGDIGAGDTEYSNTMRYEDSLQFPAGTFFLYLPHYKQSVVAIYGNWVFCRRRADN